MFHQELLSYVFHHVDWFKKVFIHLCLSLRVSLLYINKGDTKPRQLACRVSIEINYKKNNSSESSK